MDFQSSKIELAKLILNLENPKLLNKIITLLQSEQADFFDELSKLEKKEIQIGLEQLNDGKRISVDDFLKKVS